jgi:hypothetical protein
MSGMSRRELQTINVPVSHPRVGKPKSVRRVVSGAYEVLFKMDELEAATYNSNQVASYEELWINLRNWLEANGE